MKNNYYIDELKRRINSVSNENDVIKILNKNLPKKTMYEYMKYCNKNNLNNISLEFDKRKISYSEFFSLIDDYAKGLLSIGIKKGDRVALLLANLPESTIIIYALNKIGAISDNIDPTSKPDRIKYFLEKEKINSIICFDYFYDKTIRDVEDFIYDELKIKKVLITKISDSLNLKNKLLYKINNIKNNRNKAYKYKNVEFYTISDILSNSKYQYTYTNTYTENDVATICHSSGSEGIPKTLPSTNENINFIAIQHQISNIDYSNVKSFLHILPGFAQFGFSDSMHLGHCLGLKMIEVPVFSHDNIIKLLVKTKANCIFGEPSLFLRMALDKKYDSLNLSFLKEAVYGGGRLSDTQIELINRYLISHGAKTLIRTGYGMSEFNGTCILENPFNSTLGSCGKVLIGGKGLILDEQQNIVNTNQTGELYFTKASMPLENFDDKELYRPLIIDGLKYMPTGDLMHKINDEYFFDSRNSRMICRYDGYKVYPTPVEDSIINNEKVVDAMVSDYYDEKKYGNMPLVYVILNKDYNDSEIKDTIKNIINNYILKNKSLSYKDIPTKWKFVSELPRTSSLKKDYKKIKNSIDGSEYTIICNENNIGLKDYYIESPVNVKKLIKKI